MEKLIVLGDSIMQGWQGFVATTDTIADQIGRMMNWTVLNTAVGGTQISAGQNSLVQMVDKYDFSEYDHVIIGYGANDYAAQNESLDDISKGLAAAFNKILDDNPHIDVFVELPIQNFSFDNEDLDYQNTMGVSQNDICNLLLNYANWFHFNYIDWRDDPVVTEANRNETLGDTTVHPNQSTYNEMAFKIKERLTIMAHTKIFTGMKDGAEVIDANFSGVEKNLDDYINKQELTWFDLPLNTALVKGAIHVALIFDGNALIVSGQVSAISANIKNNDTVANVATTPLGTNWQYKFTPCICNNGIGYMGLQGATGEVTISTPNGTDVKQVNFNGFIGKK